MTVASRSESSLEVRARQIEMICGQVAEEYVFRDTAREIVAVMRGNLESGRYRLLDDDKEFATAVTRDLQSVNGDLHLRLLYSEAEVPLDDPYDYELHMKEAELSSYGIGTVKCLAGNIGYLEIRRFFDINLAAERVAAALTLLANTDALIIDIREICAGTPETNLFVSSYLFDVPAHITSFYWRASESVDQWWTLPYVPGARFGGTKPVYVLTSVFTFSGGEAFAYNLQACGRAKVVGEVTRGAAHPSKRFWIGEHLKTAIPNGRPINPLTGGNWEGTGVRPDVEADAEKAFDSAYRLALEHVITLGSSAARTAISEQARNALNSAALRRDPAF